MVVGAGSGSVCARVRGSDCALFSLHNFGALSRLRGRGVANAVRRAVALARAGNVGIVQPAGGGQGSCPGQRAKAARIRAFSRKQKPGWTHPPVPRYVCRGLASGRITDGSDISLARTQQNQCGREALLAMGANSPGTVGSGRTADLGSAGTGALNSLSPLLLLCLLCVAIHEQQHRTRPVLLPRKQEQMIGAEVKHGVKGVRGCLSPPPHRKRR